MDIFGNEAPYPRSLLISPLGRFDGYDYSYIASLFSQYL